MRKEIVRGVEAEEVAVAAEEAAVAAVNPLRIAQAQMLIVFVF
jgi:hypothetical protein